MKKNSGFIGKEQLPDRSSGNGIHSVYDCYVARKDNKWPKRKVFISCTPNVANHYEGGRGCPVITEICPKLRQV